MELFKKRQNFLSLIFLGYKTSSDTFFVITVVRGGEEEREAQKSEWDWEAKLIIKSQSQFWLPQLITLGNNALH